VPGTAELLQPDCSDSARVHTPVKQAHAQLVSFGLQHVQSAQRSSYSAWVNTPHGLARTRLVSGNQAAGGLLRGTYVPRLQGSEGGRGDGRTRSSGYTLRLTELVHFAGCHGIA